MLANDTNPVKTLDDLKKLFSEVKEAQKKFAEYSQEEVDRIFKAAALAADKASISLAKEAVNETGMGNVSDKIIKNRYAAEFIYNQYKDTKTCGVVEVDELRGTEKLAEPLGVLAAVVPCTNPTSTAIFKCLLALKTRNGLIFSPHPRSKKCTYDAVKIVYEAAVKAGAPENIIACLTEPTIELSGELMRLSDCILATGGPGMVAAAYSSGKPALGVGPGNVPVIVDSSSNLDYAASAILHSKSFDNGVICASEQNCIVVGDVYDQFKKVLVERGAYLIPAEEMDKFRSVIMRHSPKDPSIMSASPLVVGKTPVEIAKMAGVTIPEDTRVLVGEITNYEPSEAFAHEKLSPVLSLIKAKDFENALAIAEHLVEHGGHGHTASLYIDSKESKKISLFADKLETGRLLINTPSSQGGIGGIYSDAIRPSLTLGCGSYGGNSTWENIGVDNLLNYKIVAKIQNDTQSKFYAPGLIFAGKGALKEGIAKLLKNVAFKKYVLVYDTKSKEDAETVAKLLKKSNRKTVAEIEVKNNADTNAYKVANVIKAHPDTFIVAVGNGSAISAAKIARLIARIGKIDFSSYSLPFLSEEKRINDFASAFNYLVVVENNPWERYGVSQCASLKSKGKIEKLISPSFLADMVILDKEMVHVDFVENEEKAFGALSKFISSYTSINSNPMIDKICVSSIRKIYSADNKISKNKAIELGINSSLVFSNTFGGFIDGAASSIAHLFNKSVNAILTVLLPEYVKAIATDSPYKMGTSANYIVPVAKSKIIVLARKLGFEGEDEEVLKRFINWLMDARVKHHLPTCLSDLGISPTLLEENLDAIVENIFLSESIVSSPIYPRIDRIKEWIRSLL